MSDEEFQTLLDEHGGDPARWPEPRRGEAQALLAAIEAGLSSGAKCTPRRH